MSEIDIVPQTQKIKVSPGSQRIVISPNRTVEVVGINPIIRIIPIGDRGPIGPQGPRGVQGDPGPQGEQGPPGTGSAAYTFDQGTPDDVWLIHHNLGYYPNVTVVDSGGSQAEGQVRYIDANTLEITFTAVFGGKAYLS